MLKHALTSGNCPSLRIQDTQDLKKQWMIECMSVDLESKDEDLDPSNVIADRMAKDKDQV
jgi:hypothetical protein